MDFGRLQQIEDLFRHRWDNVILICLHDQRLRFTDLARALTHLTGDYLADGVLSASLKRLSDQGLIRRDLVKRRQLYTLTDRGQARFATIAAIGEICGEGPNSTAEQNDKPEDETSGTARAQT